MGKSQARICVVTAGHLATCPRMLKAADALAGAGHDVRVVSTRFMDWADEADRDVRQTRTWRWTAVDSQPGSGRRTYLRSGLRCRAAQAGARLLGPARTPPWLAARAFGRLHSELVQAALAEPADLFYGGTTGGLAATAEAARRAGTPYALDLEDFFSGEHEDTEAGRRANDLAARIEHAVLPGAAFLTAGSEAIAGEYRSRYGVAPIPVHNTFPLPDRAPSLEASPGPGLKLYWFSQTIGLGRGLEDVVRAMGKAGLPGELHLRGRAPAGAVESLERLAAEAAPRLLIIVHEPAPPDRMVELCAGYNAGLAVEEGRSLNRRLCLTNKALTYILAGLPVVATGTPGQLLLARDLGPGALVYLPGDIDALAAGLRRWAEDRDLLAHSRAAAWEAAQRRWHWEHPEERGAVLNAVAEALAGCRTGA